MSTQNGFTIGYETKNIDLEEISIHVTKFKMQKPTWSLNQVMVAVGLGAADMLNNPEGFGHYMASMYLAPTYVDLPKVAKITKACLENNVIIHYLTNKSIKYDDILGKISDDDPSMKACHEATIAYHKLFMPTMKEKCTFVAPKRPISLKMPLIDNNLSAVLSLFLSQDGAFYSEDQSKIVIGYLYDRSMSTEEFVTNFFRSKRPAKLSANEKSCIARINSRIMKWGDMATTEIACAHQSSVVFGFFGQILPTSIVNLTTKLPGNVIQALAMTAFSKGTRIRMSALLEPQKDTKFYII